MKKKKEKSVFTSRRKKLKKEKKFDLLPPGIKPEPQDSESDVLTTSLCYVRVINSLIKTCC